MDGSSQALIYERISTIERNKSGDCEIKLYQEHTTLDRIYVYTTTEDGSLYIIQLEGIMMYIFDRKHNILHLFLLDTTDFIPCISLPDTCIFGHRDYAYSLCNAPDTDVFDYLIEYYGENERYTPEYKDERLELYSQFNSKLNHTDLDDDFFQEVQMEYNDETFIIEIEILRMVDSEIVTKFNVSLALFIRHGEGCYILENWCKFENLYVK